MHNHLLNSIEVMGGAEFGTASHRMVFPMDIDRSGANLWGADSMHFADKLLKGVGNLQAKLSGWQLIHSVQVRSVAEQIVQKISRALHEGQADFHMADMGVTQDVVDRLRKDLPNIARYHNGRLMEFDITKAQDKEAAYQLVQAVHRGASQIIQGTLLG